MKLRLKQILLTLGVVVALYILSNLSYTIGYGISTQLPEDRLKSKSHVTLFTDLMEVTARHMLNLSKKGE